VIQAGLIVASLLAAVLGWAATKPDTFRVERTRTMQAPPEKIVAMLEDFRQWRSWSPFEKLDPAMERGYSGPQSGKGAVYTWKGNSKAGEGRMEIVDVSPSRVTMKLEFQRPFKASNVIEFLLQPAGNETSVTWTMQGPSLYIGKVMGLFISMDKMIGKDFESGLANLKQRVEA
jgi:hypothetical protein